MERKTVPRLLPPNAPIPTGLWTGANATVRSNRSGIVAFTCVLLIVLLAVGYFLLINPFGKSSTNLLLAVVMIAVGIAPLMMWLPSYQNNSIPVLELHGLFYALCFGLAGFIGMQADIEALTVTDGEVARALGLAICSLLACYLGFAVGLRVKQPSLPDAIMRDDISIHVAGAYVCYPMTLLLKLAVAHLELQALSQTANALHLGTFLWVLHAAWSGRLPRAPRSLVLWGYIPIDFVLHSGLASAAIAPLMVFGQLVGITYISVRRRIPMVWVAFAAALFALLQPVKAEYRYMTWNEGTAPSVFAGSVAFLRLGLENLARTNSTHSFAEDMHRAYSRINHLHVTAAIVADTPAMNPYLYGESYLPLLTKWIPRMLWEGKPREDYGNRWAAEYGYLAPTDDRTSFNLPWMPEMYMNWGLAGVVAISTLVGMLMAVIWKTFARGACTSIHFSVGLMMCSAFFFPESNLSLELGGLVIYVVVLLPYFLLVSMWPLGKPARSSALR